MHLSFSAAYRCGLLLGGFLALAIGCDQNTPSDGDKIQRDIDRRVQIDAPPPIEPESIDPAEVLSEAREAVEAGDMDQAEPLTRKALANNPSHPEAVFMMAQVLAQRHRFAEAIRMLDRFGATDPNATLPILGQTADWMVIAGNWNGAEERYRSILSHIPDAALVHRNLASLFIRQGRRLEAANHLRELCRDGNIEERELRLLLNGTHSFAADTAIEDAEPIGRLGKARHEISQGNWTQAKSMLTPLDKEYRSEAELLGRIFAHQQELEALQNWAEVMSNLDPETADGWFARGAFELLSDNPRAAVKDFCEAVIRDQTDWEAYSLMSQALSRLGAEELAEAVAERADLIKQSQWIGNEMSATNDRDLKQIAELSKLLERLQRPLESLAWQAVQVAYGQSVLSSNDQQQLIAEINRRRIEKISSGGEQAPKDFILCGVVPDSLPMETETKGQVKSKQ